MDALREQCEGGFKMSAYKDTKQGTWYVSFRYIDWTGKKTQKLKRGFKTKKEALNYEKEFIRKTAADMKMEMNSFIQVYFEDKKNELKENSIRNKQHMMNKHIVPYFGTRKMNEITPAEIIQWQNTIQEKGYSKTYERMIQNQLNALFNHAQKIYNLKENPCKKVKKMGKSDANKLEFWTKTEYDRFIAGIEPGSEDYLIFEILFWTGIREGELLALSLSDFDMSGNLLHINKTYNRIRKRDVIDTPKTEQTISGPKDSFTENYNINIGLIRKRIKSKDLILEEFTIGNLTNTKVGILYMDNIVLEELLNEVRKKLNEINIDGIIDASYITEILSSKNIVFPLITETERPDLATMSLLEGKVLIAVDNSPYMVIIPTFFSDLFSAPEDYYQRSKNVTFTRIIRITAFLLAILLPAFFIAITTYNHETIPLTLIINFAAQRQGVPFPSIIEALLMILIFEILRESDIRMPSLGGSAISILGAIVLGDAAVSAGIVSPIMVIVVATSAMCSLMFSHISMVNAIRFWRIIFMLFSTILGLPGLYFCIFLFVIYLSSLKSFGKPYLYPFAPFNFQGIKDTLFKQNIKNINKRNPLLTNKNIIRSKNL